MNEYKQAGYSAMLDTLQIYSSPIGAIDPFKPEDEASSEIERLCEEEFAKTEQEMVEMRYAGWTPIYDSLSIYTEFCMQEYVTTLSPKRE